MAPIYKTIGKRRWLVKDTLYLPWRDLPGTYTGAEMWEMLNKRRFSDAMPVDEPPAKEVASDD